MMNIFWLLLISMLNIVSINAEIIYNSTIFPIRLPSKSCNALSIWNDNKITIIPGSGSKELYEIDLLLQQKTLKTINIKDNIFWDGIGLTYATSSNGIIYYIEYPTNILKKIDINNNYAVSSTNIQDKIEKYCIALDEINSIIYITGGLDSYRLMTRVLKCSLQTEECQPISPMNIARQMHVCQFWKNKLYVFSGYTAGASIEVLDTTFETNEWQLLDTGLSMNRFRARSVINPNTEQVIIAGGYTNQGNKNNLADLHFYSIEIFNMKDNTMENYNGYLWEYTEWSSMTFDINNQIAYYVGGGYIDCYDTIQVMKFPTSVISTTTSSPNKVTTSFLDNFLYLIVIGGIILVLIISFIVFCIIKKKKERGDKMRLVQMGSISIASNTNHIQIASYGSSSIATNIVNTTTNMDETEQSKSKSKSKSHTGSELFGDFTKTTKGEGREHGSFKPNTNILNDDDNDDDMYDPPLPDTIGITEGAIIEGATPQTPQ